MKEEYDAVRALAGLSNWQQHDAGESAPYATALCQTESGRSMSVALARPTHMGGRSTSPIATTLTDRLQPACLAMCGVCAGNPGATTSGDVVVASLAYEWDEGKHTAGAFRHDHQQFPQDTRWIRAAQELDASGLPSHGVATDDEAAVWYLERLHRGQNPRKHPARDRYFTGARWQACLEWLESDGLITWRDHDLSLTAAGRDRIERLLYVDIAGPERLPLEVFAGAMASGSAVVSERGFWDRPDIGPRKLLALELEAATIATIAHERQVPHWLVAKGVMDHADPEKDDRFKAFAARASAEVLFALLGRLLSAESTTSRASVPVSDAVKLAVVRQLTYEWQDLADVVGVPSYETLRFRAGDEPRELWAWLESRGRLSDLPGALDEVGRGDLAGLLRPHL